MVNGFEYGKLQTMPHVGDAIVSPEYNKLFEQDPGKAKVFERTILELMNILDTPASPLHSLGDTTEINGIKLRLLSRKRIDMLGEYKRHKPTILEVCFDELELIAKISPLVYHSGGLKEMVANEYAQHLIAESSLKGVRVVPALWAVRSEEKEIVVYPLERGIISNHILTFNAYLGKLRNVGNLHELAVLVARKEQVLHVLDNADFLDLAYTDPDFTAGKIFTSNVYYDPDRDEILLTDINIKLTDAGGYMSANEEFESK